MLGDDWQRTELQESYGPHWMSYLRVKILEQSGRLEEALAVAELSRRLLGVDGDPSRGREASLMSTQCGFANDETMSTSSNLSSSSSSSCEDTMDVPHYSASECVL